LAERIKQDVKFACPTILMLTSAGHRGDAARCRELGIAAYLTKPVRQAQLRAALLSLLGQKVTEAGTLVTRYSLQKSHAGEGMQILLAEDNVVNQQLAVRLLQKRGHRVVVAGNGKEALRALAAQAFDVVLMDVQMPEMDGFEVTAAIRAQEKITGAHQLIVAMTAHAMKGDRERCLAAGMDDYISKPVQASELFATLDSLRSRKAERLMPS